MRPQETKLTKAFAGLAAVIFLFSIGCASAGPHASPQTDGRALIKHVEGIAEVSGPAGAWSRARESDALRQGDQVRTGANGKIDFDLGTSGGVLTLMPESLLRFEQLGSAPSGTDVLAILDLREGRVVGDTLQLPPHKKILVKTRTGSYEIR